jgi:hypothetical protein
MAWFTRRHCALSVAMLFSVMNFAVYQNCAPVAFKSPGDGSAGILGNPQDPPSVAPIPPDPPVTPTPPNIPTTPVVPTPPVTLPPVVPTLPPTPPPSDIKADIPSADIDFGQVLLNTTSAAKSIIIKNNTPDDDILITLGTSGAAQYFIIDQSACAAGIKPNATCKIDFKFTAVNLLPQDALVKIVAVKKSDATRGMSAQFHLKGVGYSDLAVDIPAADIDFGNQVVINTSSPVRTITITNKTPSDAISIAVTQTNPGVFTIDSSSCLTVLIAGTCTVKFTFNPKNTTAQTSTVNFVVTKKNDPATPPLAKSIKLLGTGATDIAVDMPLSNVDFGKIRLNSSQIKSIQITNRTPSDSVVITASMVSTDFTLDPNSSCLKQALAINATCNLTFGFSPVVTTAKAAIANVTIVKSSDAASKLLKPVNVTGSGFIILPSSLDQLFLVGWYSRKETTKVSYINRTADNSACPALTLPPAGQDIGPYAGQQKEFCFEPSGAHGLQLATTPASLDLAGSKLTDFVLQDGGFRSVPTLDQLFSSPADHTSDTINLKEALFYYALGYLNIPNAQIADAQFDVRFIVHNIDDALGIVVNNRFAGYWALRETWGTQRVVDPVLNIEYMEYPGKDFPISLKTGKDNSLLINPSPWGTSPSYGFNNTFATNPLKEGANTVTAIWLDNNASQRNIVGAKLQYKTTQSNGVYKDLPVFLPNVIQGYAYDGTTGTALSAVNVQVVDAVTGSVLQQTATDGMGFYRFQNVPDGSKNIVFTKGGYAVQTENRVLNHKDAKTAILDVSRGL